MSPIIPIGLAVVVTDRLGLRPIWLRSTPPGFLAPRLHPRQRVPPPKTLTLRLMRPCRQVRHNRPPILSTASLVANPTALSAPRLGTETTWTFDLTIAQDDGLDLPNLALQSRPVDFSDRPTQAQPHKPLDLVSPSTPAP